jgi:hypothetical protein
VGEFGTPDWIPFLSSYPLWVRIFIIVLLLIGAGVLVVVPRRTENSKQPLVESPLQQNFNVGHQNAQNINNYYQVPSASSSSATPTLPVISPAQEQLLILIIRYQRQFAADKLVIGRQDGTLVFDNEPEKGKGVSLIADLYGSVNQSNQAEFEKLMEDIPQEYLRVFPEARWDSPFVVSVTEAGQRYLRASHR